MNNIYQKLKAEHKCTECHKPLPEGYTYVMCESCREKSKKYRRKRTNKRWKYKLEGRCPDCCKPLPEGYTLITCPDCLAKSKFKQARLARKKKMEATYPTWEDWHRREFRFHQAPIKPCAFASYPEVRCSQTDNDPVECAKCRKMRIPYQVALRLHIKPLEEEMHGT